MKDLGGLMVMKKMANFAHDHLTARHIDFYNLYLWQTRRLPMMHQIVTAILGHGGKTIDIRKIERNGEITGRSDKILAFFMTKMVVMQGDGFDFSWGLVESLATYG